MSRHNVRAITEATDLACLIGYLAEMEKVAMEHFITADITAEEAMSRAIAEWQSSNAYRDSKED